MDDEQKEDLKRQQAQDQQMALRGDILPRTCMVMYRGFMEQGFNADAAFKLVSSYLAGLAGGFRA